MMQPWRGDPTAFVIVGIECASIKGVENVPRGRLDFGNSLVDVRASGLVVWVVVTVAVPVFSVTPGTVTVWVLAFVGLDDLGLV